MAIAHQSAMPGLPQVSRLPAAVFPVPTRQPGRTLAKIGGLIALTSVGVAVAFTVVLAGAFLLVTSLVS